jgi:sporulation protein YlmC with PRC-barrel domain
MTSDGSHPPSTHPHGASIGERAAVAAQEAAHRARDKVSRLVRAREAREFAFGRDTPDIRGWPVYSNDGERVGVVGSLLIDMRTRAIRYLGVSVSTLRTRAAGEVLVPIGWASRSDDRHAIVVHGLTRAQLVAAPRVSRRPITRADEHAALAAYGALPSTNAAAHELYRGPLFDERRLFGGSGSNVPRD